MRGPADEIEVCLALRPDLCGRDWPFERAELVGVDGRTEQSIRDTLWTEHRHDP